jgi:hypothetical protein
MIPSMDSTAERSLANLPTGTVTFLFSDIEGSTRLLDGLGPRYDEDAEGLLLEVANLFERAGDASGEIVTVHEFGTLAAIRGDDATAVRFAAAARAAAAAMGAELPKIPPVTQPIEAATNQLPPEVVERERQVGVAIGAKAILSAALASGRAVPEEAANRP